MIDGNNKLGVLYNNNFRLLTKISNLICATILMLNDCDLAYFSSYYD